MVHNPAAYLISAWPHIAGQNQPNAMVTKMAESSGHENRFENMILFLRDTFRYLNTNQSTNSAMANAENNFGLNRYDLYIHSIVVNEGPTRKWRRFGARGRVKPWLRRSSHISVILREREEI